MIGDAGAIGGKPFSISAAFQGSCVSTISSVDRQTCVLTVRRPQAAASRRIVPRLTSTSYAASKSA